MVQVGISFDCLSLFRTSLSFYVLTQLLRLKTQPTFFIDASLQMIVDTCLDNHGHISLDEQASELTGFNKGCEGHALI